MSRCACVPLNQGVGAVMVSFIQLLSSIGIIAVIILIVAGFMRAFLAVIVMLLKSHHYD